MAQTSNRSQQPPTKGSRASERDGRQELHDLQDQASDTLAEVSEKAKEVAAEAGDRVGSMFEEQKRLGARYLARLVGAAGAAADELGRDSPQAATTLRGVVDQVREFSKTVESRNASQLLDDLQRFARDNPAAFLGMTALLGFGAARFLRASKPPPPTRLNTSGAARRPEQAS